MNQKLKTKNLDNDKHGLVRGLLLEDIVQNISKKLDIEEDEALDLFYTSNTGRAFSDNETGLYGQSALYTLSLFYQEKNIEL